MPTRRTPPVHAWQPCADPARVVQAGMKVAPLILPLACALLFGCRAGDAPSAPEPEPAPLSYIQPGEGFADYDSAVAPYVLARGAGPARLAPDGRTVVMRLSLTGTRQLYAMDALADDPKGTLRLLTDGAGVTVFEFSPDGALLYGADADGDERDSWWLIGANLPDAGTTPPRLLLPATEQGFRAFGGFSGDGRMLVYTSTERNGRDYDVYALDLASGNARLVRKGEGGTYVHAVAPDGSTAVMSEAVGTDADRLFIVDMDTGERTLLSDPEPRADHVKAGVSYTADGQALLLATNRAGDPARPVRLSLKDGRLKPIALPPLAQVDGFDVDRVERCGRSLVITVNRNGVSDLHLTGPNTVRTNAMPDGVMTIDCTADAALVRVSGPDIPGDLYLLDLDVPVPVRIFASDYGELDKASLIIPESVRITARDGVELQGLLYLPRGVSRPPVVFQVHGGPAAQARPTYNASAQYLLSRGIAVFQPNVRGSTGFGRAYSTLDDRERREDSVRDLVDMLAGLEADGRVDADRAAVTGRSYGGYLVNAVLADYPDAFKAGVVQFGIGDWVAALETASPAVRAADIVEYGDISDPAVRDFHARISPIARADRIRVPVLYAHGAQDPRVSIAETEAMVRALRGNGVRAEFIRFSDEGHGWSQTRNRLFFERRQAEFLEAVLEP